MEPRYTSFTRGVRNPPRVLWPQPPGQASFLGFPHQLLVAPVVQLKFGQAHLFASSFLGPVSSFITSKAADMSDGIGRRSELCLGL
jgi:hypothetical protein